MRVVKVNEGCTINAFDLIHPVPFARRAEIE